MKKICFVAYDMAVTGGAEQVTVSLANQLCKEYEVYIYSIHDSGKIAYQLDSRIHYRKELKNVNRLRQMITQVFRPFVDYIKKENIEIVITMGNYPALVVSLCRFFVKAKFVFCDHGALINQWHQKDITAIRYWDALCSHKIVTLTEQTKKDYIEKFHISKKKVRCIYNWIDPNVLNEKKIYNKDSKCILSIGRFGKEKGYDLLVEIAKQVLPKHPDWSWHLYGTGETFDEIRQKVEEYDLTKQVVFMGNVKEAYKEFYKYAFLVLPSYREGLPVVLLEASACGLPMVSFDIMTGPNEIIVDGDNGFLVPPYDCDEMASKIERLISCDELRMEQSVATQKYLSKFEYKTILAKWKALFECL